MINPCELLKVDVHCKNLELVVPHLIQSLYGRRGDLRINLLCL